MSTYDLDALADWLESDNRSEDCFDIHGLHGYLTALHLCGEPLSDEWLNAAIDQPLTDLPEAEAAVFAQSCVELSQTIAEELYSDDTISLTFEPSVDWQESDMQAWCQGFMEVVFELPEQWQHPNEEQLALLLLPIETASGFFEEEADFQKLYQQPKLLQQMFSDIPEVLTDIYLLFNAPSK
ncbi:YecA family protein [Reinekea thalattae]|uniref:YecA family protein n=1 Tax=Reinekea thalattae TaxID=2593301 RepID=A0A5C8Z9Q3_9GAMM|nr:YecA family protein [Reinekea thalattae]TXR53596.1 YecA family protein [Reinekea thalattae]